VDEKKQLERQQNKQISTLRHDTNGKGSSFSPYHLLNPFSNGESLTCFLYLVQVVTSNASSYENECEEQCKKGNVAVHGILSFIY
jgi:hypothetical protein